MTPKQLDLLQDVVIWSVIVAIGLCLVATLLKILPGIAPFDGQAADEPQWPWERVSGG